MRRAYLLHLSFNMWFDRTDVEGTPHNRYCETLQCDEAAWDAVVNRLADCGFTTVVVDLGDGARWHSRPEIALPDAWSRDRLKKKLEEMRALGLEPIPKFNFSASHDAWMRPYDRMVSTPVYYDVCADLIAEAAELFDGPPLFHLGYEEENLRGQQRYEYIVIRGDDLWWHDLFFLCDRVRETGARPWIWAEDLYLEHRDLNDPDGTGPVHCRLPKNILTSNWYYGADFTPANPRQKMLASGYEKLERLGFDQVPCCSNLRFRQNAAETVAHCRKIISPEHLTGFIMTTWLPTVRECRDQLLEAAGIGGEAFPGEK